MRIQEGDIVTTKTTSGEEIECTVIRRDGDELLLKSPAHGYAIIRRTDEVKKAQEQQ